MVLLRHALTCGAFVSNLMLGGTAAAQPPSGQTPAYPQAPVVADSSMRLQVKPRDTMVFVDGYFAGIVDDFDGTFQRLHVDAGQHRVQLFLPGHRLYTQDLYLQPGNTFTVRHTMEPLGAGEPEPDRPTGSPLAARPPSAPPPASAPVGASASSGGTTTTSYGTLAIRVQPEDGVVLIDGERWNGGSGDAIEVQLHSGTHTVEVQKAGFRVYLTEVTVKAGEATRLNIALAPEK
jgi:hypothetical protein